MKLDDACHVGERFDELALSQRESLIEQALADEQHREDTSSSLSVGLQVSVETATNADQTDEPQGEHSEGGDEQQVSDALRVTAAVGAEGEAVAVGFEVSEGLFDAHAVAIDGDHAFGVVARGREIADEQPRFAFPVSVFPAAVAETRRRPSQVR